MTARLDRGTLRTAGFVVLLTVVFLVTNTAVAAAADGTASATGAGLLGPLDILTREGAPLSGYQLDAVVAPPKGIPAVGMIENGGVPDIDVIGHTQRLVMSGLFTLVRLLVGLSCWLIGFVFKFPLLTLLTGPAQRLADAYQQHVVGALGLQGLLLSWAFVFGLILFVRGKVGTGLGEITMTLVITALAASAFIRPDYLLGKDGPLAQTHQAAIEVASITTSSYFDDPGRGGRPCSSLVGPAHEACVNEEADAKTVSTPIQNALTDALIVKPYMLLQYGRVLDPKNPDEAAAYRAHAKWIKSGGRSGGKGKDGSDNSKCEGVFGPIKESCEAATQPDVCDGIGPAEDYCRGVGGPGRPGKNPCDAFDGIAKDYCELGDGSREQAFSVLLKDLEKAGPVGKACAAYAITPSWDRVWSVIFLLIAVIVVALMVVSMAVVMLGSQGADAAAAAAGPIVWVWAMLPGPSRMVLWRWLGVFIVSALVSFMAAMALPFFGIAVDALLNDAGPDQIVERLLLVDAFAVAFLAMHRRILAATAGFGQRMTTRMQFSKIGGSHLSGDKSEFGAALAVHGPRPGAGAFGLGGGPSSAHNAFGARLRSLGSLSALTDPVGLPFAPGRLVGDALAEGRRGIAPLALALRGAHALLVGPPPARHPAATALHQAASGQHPAGEMQVDQQTGEVLHDPATDRPLLGSRIHARASRLRSYRAGAGTARVAYGATIGLPRTLWHARRSVSEFTQDAATQLRVAGSYVGNDLGGWAPVGRPVLRAGRAVGSGIRNGGRIVGDALWERPAAPSSATDDNTSGISYPRDPSVTRVTSGPAVRPVPRTDPLAGDRSGGGPTSPTPAPMRRAGSGSAGEGIEGGSPRASTGSDREATSRPAVRPAPGPILPQEERPLSRRTPPPPPGRRPRSPETGPADGPPPAQSLLEEIRRRREQERENERRRQDGGSE
ncbi:hypothetical protein ACFYYB_26135 [Streptomyces sp. NPDC002886]|uniref:hypothetical protein n=1 Tax=Streptomyces sp. NPDC002886 TaxID=3364667 RepID=UPI00369F6DEB